MLEVGLALSDLEGSDVNDDEFGTDLSSFLMLGGV